jgi:3-oxoacyl-[acyl-carrier protein] reductase
MPLMSCELPVTIISGGSRGLGRALVEQALSRGDRVATFSRVPGPFVESLLADPVTRDRIYWESVDASNAEAAAGFAMAVMHRFGRIDTLINNAGVGIEGLLTTMSRASIASGIAINLSSVIALTQASVKCMLVGGSGCIINVSSVNGLRGHKGLAVYSATKAALVAKSAPRAFASMRLPQVFSRARWCRTCLMGSASGSCVARRCAVFAPSMIWSEP